MHLKITHKGKEINLQSGDMSAVLFEGQLEILIVDPPTLARLTGDEIESEDWPIFRIPVCPEHLLIDSKPATPSHYWHWRSLSQEKSVFTLWNDGEEISSAVVEILDKNPFD